MKKRLLIDTQLNIWIKQLGEEQKKQFFKAFYSNEMLFDAAMDDDLKRRQLNNYRYKGLVKGPDHAKKFQIFVSALTIDANLHIHDLFPEMPVTWVYEIVPQLLALLTANSRFINSKVLFEKIVQIINTQRNVNTQLSDTLHNEGENKFRGVGNKNRRFRENTVQHSQ